MSYIVPSPLIYQQLANAGGAVTTTPSLDTCIIGPAYNILSYVGGSTASQVQTAAISTVKTTGDATANSKNITNLVAPGSFSLGDQITVIGAGANGANLVSTIAGIAGNIFTLADAASVTVTGTTVAKTGKITNALTTNTFNLPGQIAGQVVTLSSVVPWLNNTKVETALTGFYGYTNQNTVTNNAPSGVTGSISASSNQTTLTITTSAMATQFAIGDSITIVAAGPAAANLTTKIINISGTTFTVADAASTTVNTTNVTKTAVVNLNSTTNTLRAESGDEALITYTNGSNVASVFTTTIQSVATTSGNSGSLVSFTLADSLPIGFSTPTTIGTVGASSTSLSITGVTTNFATGDTVEIMGAGTAGAVHTTTITVSGSTFTLGVAAVTAVTGVVVNKVLKTGAQTTSGASAVTMNTGGATPFSTGDRIVIVGAGANGADHIATVSSVAAPTVNFSPATVTTVASGTWVRKVNNFQMAVLKTYNNQQLAAVKPISGGANFSTSTTAATGQVVIQANPEVIYGLVITADVYFAYKALRSDLSGTINEFSSINDVSGLLGVISDENPLALGLEIALANTTGRIFGIGIATDDLAGHEAALALTENHRLYCLVPLTQTQSILAAYQAHVDQFSTPAEASWRTVLVNTAIPTSQAIGVYNVNSVNANSGNNNVASNSGNYVLTASNATFISDGVVAGDTVVVTAASAGGLIASWTILTVVSNQQLVINTTTTGTAVSYYVTRNMTKDQQANAVAATSAAFGDRRVVHVQPDSVGVIVNSVTKYLPGYYLAAGIGGAVSGFPVQQGFTNIGIAGIADLQHSNYYFTKAQLNTMAGSGTFLAVQATQGGLPYIRHELTTDMSVLEYRELLLVKNWDAISYEFYDTIKPFIGKWNITPDTINVIRQTLIAKAEMLKSQKLPRIGPPLLSYEIKSLIQDPNNKDHLIVNVPIALVDPLNFVDLYLII